MTTDPLNHDTMNNDTMNNETTSNTPETDAQHAQFPMGGFTLDFARKLERERDEAEKLMGGCPLTPCSLLLRYLFLRMCVEKKVLEYAKLSDDEKILAAQCMFNGRYWPNIVTEIARKSGHPFSDYVVKHVAKIAGGETSNQDHHHES